MDTKTCEHCGVEFLPKYAVTAAYWAQRRFCSTACRNAGRAGERRSSFGKERVPLVERFWSKVNKDGPVPSHCQELGPCWVWTGATMLYGYGYLGNRRRPNLLAHRVSWELHNGPIEGEQCVLHHCDRPCCVRPSHLFLGTRADNVEDKVTKARGNTRLNLEKVAEIRRMRTDGATQDTIAVALGISQSQVNKVLTGKAWGGQGVVSDMAGRAGERNGRAKLNAEMIETVRRMRAEGWPQQEIADAVGVSQTQVSKILLGQAWKGEAT